MMTFGRKRKENTKEHKERLNPLDVLNRVKGELNKLEEVSDNQTNAEKDSMNTNLESIANATYNLIENMNQQLTKEDNVRKKLIGFFKCFTYFVTFGPLIIAGILCWKSGGLNSFGAILTILAAFINIPISSIAVLKCIAERLFNDTYRKTMPHMIVKLTQALSQYNTEYRGRGNH